MELKEILGMCDHTLLAQGATWAEIKAICDDGIKYQCASVCIPASYVKQAAEYVQGKLPICTVIGFPNGYDTTAAKCFMATDAVDNGAEEVDMVINIGWVKDQKWDELLAEIKAIKAACKGKLLKVIIECCLLTDEEKVKMCEIVTASGADYIKTSTGFGGGGATREDVALFAKHVGPNVKIKAAGGIADLKDAEDFINEAAKGAFAKTVLMPGDPLRAKFIAGTFLENPRLVNNVRGIQGWTGTYHGVEVSTMASGMGIPSIGIYAHELFHFYGVENIIRVGTTGALSEKLKLRDLVIAQGACTDSNFAHHFGLPGVFAPIADFRLLETAVAAARKRGLEPPVGNILSSDVFYYKTGSGLEWAPMGVLAIDMETAGLYATAAEAGKRALTICSVTDNLVTKEELPPEERQSSLTEMMEIALETAVQMAGR